MSALLPQFKQGSPPWLPPALVATTGLVSFGWLLIYALLLDRIGYLLRRAKIRHTIERITGSILIGLGVRVALEHR